MTRLRGYHRTRRGRSEVRGAQPQGKRINQLAHHLLADSRLGEGDASVQTNSRHLGQVTADPGQASTRASLFSSGCIIAVNPVQRGYDFGSCILTRLHLGHRHFRFLW